MIPYKFQNKLTYQGVTVSQSNSARALFVKRFLVQTLYDEFTSVVSDNWYDDNGDQWHVSTLHNSKRDAKCTRACMERVAK